MIPGERQDARKITKLAASSFAKESVLIPWETSEEVRKTLIASEGDCPCALESHLVVPAGLLRSNGVPAFVLVGLLLHLGFGRFVVSLFHSLVLLTESASVWLGSPRKGPSPNCISPLRMLLEIPAGVVLLNFDLVSDDCVSD